MVKSKKLNLLGVVFKAFNQNRVETKLEFYQIVDVFMSRRIILVKPGQTFCHKTGPADPDGPPRPQLEPTERNSGQASSETTGNDSGT